MSTLDTLLEMGFTKAKAERALVATDNQGVEAAMEWLLAHGDNVDDEPVEVMEVEKTQEESPESAAENVDAAAATEVESTASDQGAQMAKSLKCDECGKLFNTEAEVEFHAVKSGHQSFSESVEEKKPLTEEEKKEHLKKLEDKMKARRLAKEEDEKKGQLEKEIMRRRTGQQIVEAKKRMEEEEIRRTAELKRKEKAEEKLAKQRVLEQIQRDKEARKKMFESSSASSQIANLNVAPTQPITTAEPPAEKKEYTQTKLQVRLTNGSVLNHSFGAKESLASVRLYIQMNRTDGQLPFSLMTSFPKKIFTDEEMEMPLNQLGLVPSAVLIVTKSK